MGIGGGGEEAAVSESEGSCSRTKTAMSGTESCEPEIESRHVETDDGATKTRALPALVFGVACGAVQPTRASCTLTAARYETARESAQPTIGETRE